MGLGCRTIGAARPALERGGLCLGAKKMRRGNRRAQSGFVKPTQVIAHPDSKPPVSTIIL